MKMHGQLKKMNSKNNTIMYFKHIHQCTIDRNNIIKGKYLDNDFR